MRSNALHLAIQDGLSGSDLDQAYRENGRHLNKALKLTDGVCPDRVTPLAVAVNCHNTLAIQWLMAKKNPFRPLKFFVTDGLLNQGDTPFTKAVKFRDLANGTTCAETKARRQCVQLIERELTWSFFTSDLLSQTGVQLEQAIEAAINSENIWFIKYFFSQHDHHSLPKRRKLFEHLLFVAIAELEKTADRTGPKNEMLTYIKRKYAAIAAKYNMKKCSQKETPAIFEVSETSERSKTKSRKEESKNEAKEDSRNSATEHSTNRHSVFANKTPSFNSQLSNAPTRISSLANLSK